MGLILQMGDLGLEASVAHGGQLDCGEAGFQTDSLEFLRTPSVTCLLDIYFIRNVPVHLTT